MARKKDEANQPAPNDTQPGQPPSDQPNVELPPPEELPAVPPAQQDPDEPDGMQPVASPDGAAAEPPPGMTPAEEKQFRDLHAAAVELFREAEGFLPQETLDAIWPRIASAGQAIANKDAEAEDTGAPPS